VLLPTDSFFVHALCLGSCSCYSASCSAGFGWWLSGSWTCTVGVRSSTTAVNSGDEDYGGTVNYGGTRGLSSSSGTAGGSGRVVIFEGLFQSSAS
jgi:hypothetical protein